MVKKRRVVDVERDFADRGKSFVTAFVSENAHISRNQPPKRIEREMAN